MGELDRPRLPPAAPRGASGDGIRPWPSRAMRGRQPPGRALRVGGAVPHARRDAARAHEERRGRLGNRANVRVFSAQSPHARGLHRPLSGRGQRAVRSHRRRSLRRRVRRSASTPRAGRRSRCPHTKINLASRSCSANSRSCEAGPPEDPAYPFVLAAGERRSDTSNTAVRDPALASKRSPSTACASIRRTPRTSVAPMGDWVRLTTRRGSAEAPIEITPDLQPGHVSLPNGQGIDYHGADGSLVRRGVALNELTDVADRDPIAGTPWHKHVAARIERTSVPIEVAG